MFSIESIFLPKKSEAFEFAKNLVSDIIKKNENEDCPVSLNKWMKIIKKDPNSPLVMGMEETTYMVYYPKFSTPYEFKIGPECIFVEIMHGTVYEKYSGKTFETGQKIKLGPFEKLMPYTRNTEARIKVTCSNCEDELMNICK